MVSACTLVALKLFSCSVAAAGMDGVCLQLDGSIGGCQYACRHCLRVILLQQAAAHDVR